MIVAVLRHGGDPKSFADGSILAFKQAGLDLLVVITKQGTGSSVIVTATRS